jgi:acylphosphatase
MKCIHILISGKVQGVAYRYYMEKMARSLNLKGWVRNTEDGRVEAVIEGEDDSVNAMIEWCRKGPPAAKVSHVEVRDELSMENFNGFKIKIWFCGCPFS